MFNLTPDEKSLIKSQYIKLHDCVYLKKDSEHFYCCLDGEIEINRNVCYNCEEYSDLPFDRWWVEVGKHLFKEEVKKDMKYSQFL